MHRQHLLKTASRYLDLWAPARPSDTFPWNLEEEKARVGQVAAFAEAHADCFERTCVPGHITGSALVVSKDLDAVLLTLHKKLNAWLQLGGHSDGDPYPHQVAMREALEESGLPGLEFLPYVHALTAETTTGDQVQPLPFDFDCHVIPARKNEPAHIHYDVRYLIVGDRNIPFVISEESQDLRWFTLAEARQVTAEPSMLRQFEKLEWLRGRVRAAP
jgi:8-oxo-dGTP pyrophosphatase MutT (NUDIX family)